VGEFGVAEQSQGGLDHPQGGAYFPSIGGPALGKAVIGAEEFIGTIEEVETHREDPIDAPEEEALEDPWERLGHQISSLGEKLKTRYRSEAGASGPSEEEVREALRTLGGAWDRVTSALSAAARDEEVRKAARQAATSFAEAIEAALSEIPAHLRPDQSEPESRSGEEK
jgi:hypothetical protein